jgi:hypothetical protein
MRNEAVSVATFACALEANAAKNFLERNGIPAAVVDEYISDQTYSTLAKIKVQVLGANASRARELLDDARAS